MKTLLLALLTLTIFTAQAQASSFWAYRIESASMISGGKLKIYSVGSGSGFKKLRLKYKLDTSLGFKESTFEYNLPAKIFDPAFLGTLAVGQTVDLGTVPHAWKNRPENVKFTRESQTTYLITTSDGQFRIVPRSDVGPWKRIDFTLRGFVSVRLKGNLESTGNE